ncbi:hypothetical protein [Streptomyces sp. DG1A-41]|uniref:hypothetical protein n=1 Tax=Streptomyces sp. DG1A-41 TaxID=3125779 RepID=UPI0030CF4FC7
MAEHRQDLLAPVAGKVIEVGAGDGLDFPYHPTTVAASWQWNRNRTLRSLAHVAADAVTIVRVIRAAEPRPGERPAHRHPHRLRERQAMDPVRPGQLTAADDCNVNGPPR